MYSGGAGTVPFPVFILKVFPGDQFEAMRGRRTGRDATIVLRAQGDGLKTRPTFYPAVPITCRFTARAPLRPTLNLAAGVETRNMSQKWKRVSLDHFSEFSCFSAAVEHIINGVLTCVFSRN